MKEEEIWSHTHFRNCPSEFLTQEGSQGCTVQPFSSNRITLITLGLATGSARSLSFFILP